MSGVTTHNKQAGVNFPANTRVNIEAVQRVFLISQPARSHTWTTV